MKHTPEPWAFNDEDFKIRGTGDIEGLTVIANLSPKMDYSRGKNTQWANATRIVACVNAMANITDPQAFRDSVDKLTAYVKEVDEIIRQKEERIKELENHILELGSQM